MASTTTSAIAEPTFCRVKYTIRRILEDLRDTFKPKIIHGKKERTVAIAMYGILLLPFIGMQSDKILQMQSEQEQFFILFLKKKKQDIKMYVKVRIIKQYSSSFEPPRQQ